MELDKALASKIQGASFLVTGGAGFIGSAVIRYLMTSTSAVILNIDKLTYAGNLSSLKSPHESNKSEIFAALFTGYS